MRHNSVAIALVSVACAVVGFGAWSVSHSSLSPGTYRIATDPAAGLLLGRSGPVTLAGQANNDGTACLWVGDEHDRIVLIWPSGYTARGGQLTVFNANGKEVAAVGRQVTLGGGLTIQPSSGAKDVLGCGKVSKAFSGVPITPSG